MAVVAGGLAGLALLLTQQRRLKNLQASVQGLARRVAVLEGKNTAPASAPAPVPTLAGTPPPLPTAIKCSCATAGCETGAGQARAAGDRLGSVHGGETFRLAGRLRPLRRRCAAGEVFFPERPHQSGDADCPWRGHWPGINRGRVVHRGAELSDAGAKPGGERRARALCRHLCGARLLPTTHAAGDVRADGRDHGGGIFAGGNSRSAGGGGAWVGGRISHAAALDERTG